MDKDSLAPVSYTHLDVYKRQMYAGFLAGNTQITAASALVLSLGIAIQNFPEGAIISMPPVSYTHLDVYKRQHITS